MPTLREAYIRYATHYETVFRLADQLYRQGGDALGRGLDLFDLEWDNVQLGYDEDLHDPNASVVQEQLRKWNAESGNHARP